MYNSTIHHLFIACEPTTQSQIFFCPHVCDSLYPSPLFPLVTAISLSLCLSSCSLFLFLICCFSFICRVWVKSYRSWEARVWRGMSKRQSDERRCQRMWRNKVASLLPLLLLLLQSRHRQSLSCTLFFLILHFVSKDSCEMNCCFLYFHLLVKIVVPAFKGPHFGV